MSEQALDLQSVLSTMRRHRRLLVALTLAGGLAGAVMLHARPPMYVSSAEVLLPPPPPSSTGAGRDPATDISVALSDVVLGPAGYHVSPHLTDSEVRKRVSVSAPTSDVLRVEASGPTARAAESLAGAVADAELEYQADAASSLSEAQQTALAERGNALQAQLDDVSKQIDVTQARLNEENPEGRRGRADATALAQLTAQKSQLTLQVETLKERAEPTTTATAARVIVEPTPAKRSDLVLWTMIAVLLGALGALGISTVVLSVLSRRDRRLRTRDEVADAIGSAVIGSVRVRPQRAAAGWSALMEGYEPSVTDAWSLRQALDHVGLGDLTVRSDSRGSGGQARSRTVTLISLSDDPRALAVGPQLASHAASLGLQTRLVTKQGHESSAALWAACSALRRSEELRSGLYVDTRRRKGDDLTVELVVVDRRNPQFVGLDRNAVTLLAVASSSATAEDLARTAVAAYEAGGRISGLNDADPDSLDRTTGRLLMQQRSEQAQLPTRMTGVERSIPDESTPPDESMPDESSEGGSR
jgi:capsular polysaccharide biosynthesis protein